MESQTLGLNVIKVIVPGMRAALFDNLAPGRLYDIRIRLNAHPEQINPFPIFF